MAALTLGRRILAGCWSRAFHGDGWSILQGTDLYCRHLCQTTSRTLLRTVRACLVARGRLDELTDPGAITTDGSKFYIADGASF